VLYTDKAVPASAVLDLGALVDAIHIAPGAHLELLRLRIPNAGNRRLRRPSMHVRMRVAGIFALWPSVTLAKDSRVRHSMTWICIPSESCPFRHLIVPFCLYILR
jgi:hypothetical protein